MNIKTLSTAVIIYSVFIICMIGIFVTTLWPFVFEFPDSAKLTQALSLSGEQQNTSLLQAGIERFPFLIAAAILGGSFSHEKHKVWGICAALIATVFAFEIMQLFSNGRHARWGDFAIASILATSGFFVGRLARRRNSAILNDVIKGLTTAALVAASGLVVWSGESARQLSAWNCDYEISFGNEIGLERPWTGELADVKLTNGTHKADLLPSNNIAGPIRFVDQARIVSRPLPDQFCEQIKEARQFSISLGLRNSGKDLVGPARIMTWSTSIYDQNVMIGEQNGQLHFRVSSGSRDNRIVTEIKGPIPSSTDELVYVHASYKNGQMRLEIDDIQVATGSVTAIRLNNGLSIPLLPSLLVAAILFLLLLVSLITKPIRSPSLNES